MAPDKLYRYEAVRYSIVLHAETETYGISSPKLVLSEYNVVAETPKGYWLSFLFGSKDKWTSKTARKRFAYPTKEEALSSYIARKKAYIRHSERNLREAKADLALVCEDAGNQVMERLR